MARTIERRRVTTRKVSTGSADQLKSNISNIADELARVRDQARAEVDSLERIRGMLDVGYLNDLLAGIAEMEQRIEEIEREALDARGDADGTRKALEEEQERLAKLWDAYKAQEDELNRIKRDYPLMEEKLFERERTIESLNREIAELQGLARYKADYESLVDEAEKLEDELDAKTEELEEVNRTLKGLESELGSLRQISDLRPRVDELTQELEEERERLAKLYRVYEDLEAEKKDVEAQLDDWDAWFKKYQGAFKDVCKASQSAPA